MPGTTAFCRSCRCDRDIDVDDASGISCCVTCGAVLDNFAISNDVTFQKDAAGESTVVGQFVNESGVARGIGRIHGGRVYAYQADSHERAQQRGRQDIAHLVDQLAVRPREETIEASHRLYKLALQRGFTRGRRTNQVAAACLYLVCRQDEKPFLLIDFSDALQVNVFTLGAVFLQLAKLLRLEDHPLFSKPVDPSLYIHRFADRMEFPSKEVYNTVSDTAMRLVASMRRDWIQTGRRPSGVCGAALYIASHLHGFPRTKRQVVDVVHIGESSLAKRLTEFSSTEAGSFNRSQFEEHSKALEAQEVLSLDEATAAPAPQGLLAGCEHISHGEPHFKHGMCHACFIFFVRKTGGTYDGANPPAFMRARMTENKREESSSVLALPAPKMDNTESAAAVDEDAGDAVEQPVSGRGRGSKQTKRGAKYEETEDSAEAISLEEGEEDNEEAGSIEESGGYETRRKTRHSSKQTKASPQRDAAAEAVAAAGPSSGNNGKRRKKVAATGEVTAEAIAAAQKEVEGFDEAIAEAEQAEARRKRHRSVSTAAIIAAATAQAVRDAAVTVGAEPGFCAEDAAGAIVPAGTKATLPLATGADFLDNITSQQNGSDQTGDEPPLQEELDDGKLSEISDGDIAMYLADKDEVTLKEEIWNMMNQDWVEKQAAKKAALEAAEKAQSEQRAAMEAAASAGIRFKRGRGRPLGSKTKAKPEKNLPPPETPQEAAMRMLDSKKLSSKINYSALADLFSDDAPGGEDAGTEGMVPHPLESPGSDLPDPSLRRENIVPVNDGPLKVGVLGGPSISGQPAASGVHRVSLVSGIGSMQPPPSRIAGMAPRLAGLRPTAAGLSSLGNLGNRGKSPAHGTLGRLGGSGRLGGLNEGLSAPPMPIGLPKIPAPTAGATGAGGSARRGSGRKVRFDLPENSSKSS